MSKYFVNLSIIIGIVFLPLTSYAESPDPPSSKLEQLKRIFPNFEQLNFMANSDCPDIDFIDLRNVPGYPQIDDLNVCGAADTLSMIIFTGDPGDIKGFEFEIDLPDGIEYAGWEYAQLGGTTISAADPDPNRPTFLVDGITGDSLVIVNIGLRANCEVDKTENLFFDYNFDYVFVDTLNVVHECSGTFTPSEEFNSSVHIAVLNMLSPLDPEEATVTELGDPVCQTISLSQDGLSAYLDSFKFEIVGLELFGGDIVLDKIEVNNILVPSSDILYNAGTQTTSFNIDGTYFPANGLSNPADTQMNTNEVVEVAVCYTANSCPDAADLPFNYNAKWGCDEMTCEQSTQTSFIEIRPTGSLPLDISSFLNTGGIEICGNPGMVTISVTNPNPDSDQFAYTDVQLGFQTCDKPNLDVTGITLNGVSVSLSTYTWEGSNIVIDLTSNTNPALGLDDHDMDGFYDDLKGGTTISGVIEMSVTCGIDAIGDCANINCENVQFYVASQTDCGASVREYPSPDLFSLQFGADAVSNPTEVAINSGGTVFGYDFGTYSNDGAPISTGSSTQEVVFCYDFATTNIQSCPSGGDDYFVVDFSGDPRFILDMQFEPNSDSISIDGGATYTAVNNATLVKPDDESATLTINGGSNNSTVCYKYSITMDSCLCMPVNYFVGRQQVIHTCPDCDGGCEIVKACRDVTFKADPNCSDCDCIIRHHHVRTERLNLGYTDKTMTTQHTRESLIAAGGGIDLSRYVPGDTLVHESQFVILQEDAISDVIRWNLTWSLRDIASSATADIANLELLMDAHGAYMNSFMISKVGGTRQLVDFNILTACHTDNVSQYGGVWNTFDNGYFSGSPIDYRENHNTSGDLSDNNTLQFNLWNYDKIETCGGTNASHGGDDCLDQFLETYNIEVGDTLHFNWKAPLIKNHQRAALEGLGQVFPSEQGRIYPTLDVYANDPIAGSSTYCYSLAGGTCREWEPMNFDCPGDIGARTVMDLNDCGGTVTHEFFVNDLPGDVGDPWFTQEYRPLAEIFDVDAMIRAPLAYCANAQVEKLGLIYDVAADSMVNMFCNPVSGYDEPVCGVDTFGTIGTMVFDLASQGVPALGVGLDNCDTLRLSYDLCMVCPGDIPGVSEYNLVYDWAYVNFTPKVDGREHIQYRCNNDAANPENSICDEFMLATNDYYYEILELDTVMYKKDLESDVFLLNDNRDPMAPVTITNEGSNILASGSPGVSVEIQAVEICNPDADNATGVGLSVTIPSAVRLEDVYTDAAGTTPLAKTLISDDGTNKIYKIDLPTDTYTPGECNLFYVGTTLLFCPEPTDAPPKICVGVFSGCAPEDVKAALSASEGCAASEICYTYIFGEVGLQTEWFDLPGDIELCAPVTLNVLVKNTKELLLLDLVPTFDIPQGMSVVPGSWEVAYPGGPTTFGAWTSIPTDPDVISGNTYSYSDDALWNAYIDANGLQGVSTANVTADSNKVAFRFQVTTNCDEFLSGSKSLTETTASDPCSDQIVSSGIVQSPALIIQGADPIDYAQLLLVSRPDIINCEATLNTFGITAINSGTESTSDSVLICVTFPEGLDYQTGTVAFTSPVGFPVGTVTETPIGTATEVCFSGPAIGPYGSVSMTFDAEMDKDQACGDVYLLADIKSYVESVSCTPGPPSACGVFVQNSINNRVNVELAPPFIAEDIEVFTSCPNDQGNVELSYEFTINHNGPTANNQAYTVNFYEDVDGSLAVNSNVDNLLGSENGTFSVSDGSTVVINGTIDVPDGQSCPILFEVVYDTDCACDRTEEYLDNIKFEGLKEYNEPLTMCPGSCFDIDICDYVNITADSIKGATGIVYEPVLDWNGANIYVHPNGGPPAAYITYEDLTDDDIGNGDNNLLLAEQTSGYDDAHIVAAFPCLVQVDRFFLGGGDITGWGNVIHVYGGASMKFEYSLDGVNWTLAETGLFIPTTATIKENILAAPIVAQYFRVSSNSINRNWATSEFRLEGSGIPYEGFAPVSVAGNVATICIPEGVGIDAPWPVTFTTGTGNCAVEETIEIWGLGTPGITLEGDDFACGDECVDLEIIVPNDATAGMTVSWSPAALVDDPTAFRVEACNLTENTTFQATISYNDGACTEVIDFPVTHYPTGTINVSPDVIECYVPFSAPILTAEAGYDMYAWYEILGNNEILVHNSFSNLYIAPGPGTYFVKASSSTSQCPAISSTVVVPDIECCEEVCLPVNVTVKRGD